MIKNLFSKKAGVLLLSLGMCLGLCGCHGNKGLPDFEVPEAFDESAHYEITFWSKNDTNKAQTDIYYKAIEDFEKLYPNITVNMKLYTDYGRIYNDVITNISTQTTPNVCITYPDHIATYLTGNNIVVPLDKLMTDSRYGLGGSELKYDGPKKDQVISKFLDECSIEGVTYGLPYMRSTEACYINKTFVEKLGFEIPEVLTWDFMWEVSEAAMAMDSEGNYKVNGQKVMIPFIYKSTDNMMIQMLKQKNAPYSDSEGNIEIFNDTTSDLLKEISAHAATGAFSTFKISSYPANFLNAGQSIFAIDSTAGATWMGTEAPLSDICSDDIVPFELIVKPLPQFDANNTAMISQGPSICVFNKSNPGEVLASWLFAQFLLTNDVQIAYSETEGYVPVTTKARETEEYKDYLSKAGEDNNKYYFAKIEAANILLKNTDNTFVTPVFNGSASLRDAAGSMIESVCKSVRRKETVDNAYIEKLYSDTNSLYRLDQKTGPAEAANTDSPLPKASKVLLISLACIWILIAIYAINMWIKQKRLSK